MVEGDKFVGFHAGQPTSATQEMIQAVPLGTVGCHEDIEVHGRLLLQVLGAYGPYYYGALCVSLAD